MKNTKEIEQYSNTKIRMLPKPSPKIIRRKWVLYKIGKSEANKTSVPYVKKNKLKSKKLLKIQRKKTKIISSNR